MRHPAGRRRPHLVQHAQAGEQGEEQEAHFMSPFMSPCLRDTEPRNYAVFQRFSTFFGHFSSFFVVF